MKLAVELQVLPEIPRKRYFAIGEVSELCAVKAHVLRYWEQEFTQLKPVKRRGNRRYYQLDDVLMVRKIRSLLYEQGFTIGGARLRLRETTPTDVAGPEVREAAIKVSTPPVTAENRKRQELRQIRSELESLLNRWPF